ncbi:MAG: cyclic nucleotide-binding domain-containing protein [Planctomycetota bacterium]|nr:cyclic nucleotide-binding domain-containing protein [Planctomycetota bacterium]
MTDLQKSLAPDLTDADWTHLTGAMQTRSVDAGSAIELPDTTLGLIESGTVAVLMPTSRGVLELRELGPGEFLAEEGFVDGRAPGTQLLARDAVTLKTLDRSEVDEGLWKAHPGTTARLFLSLGRLIAGRVRAGSAVRIENIDDDPELEVISALCALSSHDCRPTQPIQVMPARAYAGRGPEHKTTEENMRDVRLLADLLMPLGHELYHGLGERVVVRTFDDGMAVLTEGEQPDGLYMLLDGEVEVRVQGEGGIRPVAKLGSGSVFGQMSFLLQTPRTATCTACGETTIGMVSAHLVDGLIRYAEQGRRAGLVGIEWIAGQCADDLRRMTESLKEAFERSGAGA